MNVIKFKTKQEIEDFRLKMALSVLRQEVVYHPIIFYKGSLLKILKTYFPDLPRTKKSAYKYLQDLGYYPIRKT